MDFCRTDRISAADGKHGFLRKQYVFKPYADFLFEYHPSVYAYHITVEDYITAFEVERQINKRQAEINYRDDSCRNPRQNQHKVKGKLGGEDKHYAYAKQEIANRVF